MFVIRSVLEERFVVAAHNMTPIAVCWALLLISKSSIIQHRLRAELHEYVPFLFDWGTRDCFEEFADVDQLPCLTNVRREALRHISPIPLSIRQALTQEHLVGYDVLAGTLIFIPFSSTNRLTI